MQTVSIDRFTDKPRPNVTILGKCACGCGELVTENHVYYENSDGDYCVDFDHALKASEWRQVG